MQVIRTSPTPSGLMPNIPPVSGLRDINGVVITLDCDVILQYDWQRKKGDGYRGRVISIGHPGLPGNEIVGVRIHGSTYASAYAPAHIEVHAFDDYEWLAAETAAATEMCDTRYRHGSWEGFQRHGADLAKCLFGGFWFEAFQKAAMRYYLRARASRQKVAA